MTGTTQSAKGTKMSGFKWLWVVVLAILATVALTIFFNAPLARRPGMAHYVAAHAGVFFSYMLFAVLIAAVIKYLTKSRWVWYDWANIVVVLATCIFIFRDYSPFPALATATEQRIDAPPPSAVAVVNPPLTSLPSVVGIVGTWMCRSSAVDGRFKVTYEANGGMSVVALGATDPQSPGAISWSIEGGNFLIGTFADASRYTKTRIVTLTANSLETANDGVEVSCERT